MIIAIPWYSTGTLVQVLKGGGSPFVRGKKKVPQLSKAPHLKNTGSNPIKLVRRDRGTH